MIISTLVSLEKVATTFDVSGMGAKVYLTAFNSKSSVRFTKDAIPALYIKIEGSGDPSDKVTVSIAVVKKDRRRFTQESTGLTGAAKDISATKASVSLKKVRDGLYQIVFDAPLASGEYAFMPQMDMGSLMGGGKLTLFCFGVD
jgi:predicted phage tail protein